MRKRNINSNPQSGAAIITAVIFFLIISVIVLVGMASPVAYQIRNAADFVQSKQGFITADTLNEEVLYRLNKGRTLPATLVLGFSSGTSTAQITDVNGMKQVISTGISGFFSRVSKSVFSQGDGVSVNYGIQVGNGGLNMSGGARIVGNVYSNGNIVGSGNPTITGSAIASAAAQSEVTVGNTSESPITLSAGDTNATQDFAQSFTVSSSSSNVLLRVYARKSGWPSNVTISLRNNNPSTNRPGTTVLASTVLGAGQVTDQFSWLGVYFSSAVPLTAGTRYWIVFDVSSSASWAYYQFGATDNSPMLAWDSSAALYRGQLGGTWTASSPGHDALFELVAGDVSSISGIVVGSGGTGDAKAFIVTNSTVAGNLYCQTGSNNNKSCDTSQSSPSPLAFPFSDANIQAWQDSVVTTQTRPTSLSLSSSNNVSTSSLRINGNLSIGGDAQLTVNGPLYVNGSVNINAGGRMYVAGPVYINGTLAISGAGFIRIANSVGGSALPIVVSGNVDLGASGALNGNGQAGSYVVLVSKSSSNSAVTVSGAAGTVLILAPYGRVTFNGGSSAKAVVANEVYMSGGTTVTYDSGLADIDFTSGPSGAWNVDSWREVAR
ncbi:MAG TPA: hypothetical protein VGE62_02775 [Candidatus Paceibacterota bacterium]